MALDTSKLLAAVSRETTQVDSLIALANNTAASLKTVSAQLAAAIAANDPAALAQAQKDIDAAAATLDTESDKTAAAISANVSPPAA